MTRLYPDRPFVGVGVVVWRGADVLLVRRAKPPREGRWSIPGGVQQIGETLVEAAVREVREETGLTVEITGLLDAVDSIERDASGDVRRHYSLIDFAADWRAGEAAPADDVSEVTWADPDALAAFDLWTETLRVIRLSAARRRDG